MFFDGVGKRPPKQKLRRDLLREVDNLKRELKEARDALKAARAAEEKGAEAEGALLPAEKVDTWEEAAELLPKGSAGNVDWMQALETEKIDPRPGYRVDAREQALFELKAKLDVSPSQDYWVTFSHETHTRWLTCKNCHPEIYPLSRKAERTVTTMAKIYAGESCGACHGSVAFGADEDCMRCHADSPVPARSAWKPPEKPEKPVEAAESWEKAAGLLPKDEAGEVDWMKALEDEVIAPRPGIGPEAEEQMVMPTEVEMVPEGSPDFKAVFAHAPHTTWLSCGSCHPEPFEMAKGATPTSMAKMYAGESCGLCHGSVAFGIDKQCARCHANSPVPARSAWKPPEKPEKPVEAAESWEKAAGLLPKDEAGEVDWMKALEEEAIAPRPGIGPEAEEQMVMPTEVEMVPEGNPDFKALFPHGPHTTWLACGSCHPGLYEMAKGANPTTMEKISEGESCGVCHGSVAFGADAACARCHPALAGK